MEGLINGVKTSWKVRGGRGLTAGSTHIERAGDLKKRCFMDGGGDAGEEMNTSLGLVLETVRKELEQKI